MKLLCIVLHSADTLEAALEGLLEVGVTGGTVVDSEGMGHIMEGVPLFAGMRNMFRSAKSRNNMVFSVISDAQAAEALDVLAKILDCAHGYGKGIAFTIPIDAAIGMHQES